MHHRCVILLFVLCWCQIGAQSIDNRVARSIAAQLKAQPLVQSYSPFAILKSNSTQTTLLPDWYQLKRAATLDFFEIQIPIHDGQIVTAVVESQNIFGSSQIKWQHQRNYRGIIKGDESTLVTLNLSSKSISGIISDRSGNIILQPTGGGDAISVFREASKNHNHNWTCDASQAWLQQDVPTEDHYDYKSGDNDTVSLYLEADYDLFVLNGSSVINTMNYLTGVMSEVAALYANENINIAIADVKIWSTPDPYTLSANDNSETILTRFRSQLNGQYDADLAHLISGSPYKNGGIAYINSLCEKSRAYAYSNVYGQYSDATSYSWDVHVIAHELGHNLGSYHTHDCVWGPNNDQPIDACANNDCGGDIPALGGTIMSYCHQQDVGINFSLGFGPEPGDVIRSRVSECKGSYGWHCATAQELTSSGSYTARGPYMGEGAIADRADNANWYKFSPHADGHISVASCGGGVDTRLFIYEGADCESLTEIATSDDDCQSLGALFYASTLDSIEVLAGATYYIVWDDRWSAKGFDFDFSYSYTEELDQCHNGIQDGDETGVDCGGSSCIPCESCNSSIQPEGLIDDNMTYRSNAAISVSDMVTADGTLMISSAQEVTLSEGFEILPGGRLEVVIESCEEYLDRIDQITTDR